MVRGQGTVAGVDSAGNKAVGRVAGGGVADGQGNKVGNVRGVAGDSQGNRKAGSVTGAQNQWGYARVNAHGGVGNVNTGTGQTFGGTAVRGPNGNVVSAGRGSAYVNGQFVGGKAWTAVNGNYTRYGYFGSGYARAYPGAWWPGKWAVAGTAWAAATWATAGAYCGCEGDGTYYDYEDNVSYEDGSVYYEGEAVATAEQYYDQADEIADAGENAENEEWMPLGVFAVIREAGQTQTDRVVQLALNKDGVIRGNLQDLLTEKVTPVYGSVDKKTQRVAMKLEGNDKLIIECGLYNLTNDEVPVLIHSGKDKQQAATLIRLKNPEEEKQQQKD